jgi:Lon protease-like protein
MELSATPTPMFPLGTVLFPYAVLPLHVFEPRYRVMMRHVLEGNQEFGVVLIERGSEVGGGDTRFETGTVARLAQASELPDGRIVCTAVGVRRLRVRAWLPDDPYPQADTEVIDEPPATTEAGEQRERVVAALSTIVELARQLDLPVGELPKLASDPVRASWDAAALAPIGPLDAQRVLEANDAAARLALLGALLDARADDLRARLRE